MSDPAPILHARGLTYAVPGRTLLEDAGLTLRRGERHVIIGRNGAGKSTLLKVLTGELTPRAGTIDVWGRSLASYRPREIARRRAVLPQHTALNFDYQVLEVALLGRLPHLGNRPETAADFALARAAPPSSPSSTISTWPPVTPMPSPCSPRAVSWPAARPPKCSPRPCSKPPFTTACSSNAIRSTPVP